MHMRYLGRLFICISICLLLSVGILLSLSFPVFGDTCLFLTEDAQNTSGNLRIINTTTGAVSYKIDLDAYEKPVQEIDSAVTPDGGTALILTEDLLRNSGSLRIIDVATGTVSYTIDFDDNEHPTVGVDMILSPDGSDVFVLTYDDDGSNGNARLVDIATGAVEWKTNFDVNEHPHEDVDPLFSLDGSKIIVMTYDNEASNGNLRIINATTGAVTNKIDFSADEHPLQGVDPVLTPDGTKVIVPTADNNGASSNVRIVDLATGSVLRKIDFTQDEHFLKDVDMLVTSDSSKMIALTYDNEGMSGYLRIMNIATTSMNIIDFPASEHPIADVDPVFTPDTSTVLVPTYDEVGPSGNLRIIDVSSGTVQTKIDFDADEYPISAVDIVVTPDGSTALMPTMDNVGWKGNLRIVDISSGVVTSKIDFSNYEHPLEGVDVAVTPDSTTALMPTTDDIGPGGNLRIIDIATGTVSYKINFDNDEVPLCDVDVVLTPDGGTALMPTYDGVGPKGNMRIVDVGTGVVSFKIDFDNYETPLTAVDALVFDSLGNNTVDFLDEDFQLREDETNVKKIMSATGQISWIHARTKQVLQQILLGGWPQGPATKTCTGLEKIEIKDVNGDYKLVFVSDVLRAIVGTIDLPGKPLFPPVKTKCGKEKMIIRYDNGDLKIVLVDDVTKTIVDEEDLPTDNPLQQPHFPPVEMKTGKEKIFIGTKVYIYDDIAMQITNNKDLGGEPEKPPVRTKTGREKIVIKSGNQRKIVFFDDSTEDISNTINIPGVPLWEPFRVNDRLEKVFVNDGGVYKVVYIDDVTEAIDGAPVVLPGPPLFKPRQLAKCRDKFICRGANSDILFILNDLTRTFDIQLDLGGKVISVAPDLSKGVKFKWLWSMDLSLDERGLRGIEKIIVRSFYPDGRPRKDTARFFYDNYDPAHPENFEIGRADSAAWGFGPIFRYCLFGYNINEYIPQVNPTGQGWQLVVLNDATGHQASPIPLDGQLAAPKNLTMLTDIDEINYEYTGHVGLLDNVNLTTTTIPGVTAYQHDYSYTETGNLVKVEFSSPMTVTYEYVSNAGTTYVTPIQDPPEPVYNYDPVGPTYDISTTAAHSGQIDIKFVYDNMTNVPTAYRLCVLHLNGSAWELVPSDIDPYNHTITAHTSSLSPFIVVMAPPPATGFNKDAAFAIGLLSICIGLIVILKKRLTTRAIGLTNTH